MNSVHHEKLKQRKLAHLQDELKDVNKRISWYSGFNEDPKISKKLTALTIRQSQLESSIYRLQCVGDTYTISV